MQKVQKTSSKFYLKFKMFNSNEWSELISTTYDFEKKSFKLKNGNVLYFNIFKNQFGDFVSLPAFGDFIDYDDKNKKLIDEFINKYKNNLFSIKLFSKNSTSVSINKVSGFIHEINFKSFDDWLNNTIKAKFRNQINQSKKYQLTSKISNEIKDLKMFYDLHKNLRIKKFNQIPQPWIFFENLYKIFFLKNKAFVISAFYNTQIISSILCIVNNDIVYYKYASSDLNFTQLRPNNFLIYELIKYLDKIGINTLNMGYTGSNKHYDGLRRFKINSGCKEYPRFYIKNYEEDKDIINFKKNIQEKINLVIMNKYNDKDIQDIAKQYYKYFL